MGILNPLELEKDFAVRLLESLALFNIALKERSEAMVFTPTKN